MAPHRRSAARQRRIGADDDSRPLVARAILRVFGTTNKHHAEQHVGFDGNRDDPFDGLLAARARK